MLPCFNINKPFSIDGFYTAFNFNWKDNFIFDGENHDFWEIVFVRSGEVEVTEDENIYTLGAGNMIFHAPMEFHRIKSSGGTCPFGFILTFKASGKLPEILTNGIFSLDESLLADYERVCKKAYAFITDEGSLDGAEVGYLLSAFISRLARRAEGGDFTLDDPSSMAASAIEYRKIVSFMSAHVCENLSLSDIAHQNNVSVSYLKLLFNNYAGISPKKYFNGLRLRHASRLLSEGNSVISVSDTMNFSSPNYFSYFYKNNTGRAPSEVKKT